MSDLDRILERLAADPPPPELASVGAEVLHRVDDYSFGSHEPRALRIGLVAAALLMGVIGGALPDHGAGAHAALSPLSGDLEYAPSTLLAGSR